MKVGKIQFSASPITQWLQTWVKSQQWVFLSNTETLLNQKWSTELLQYGLGSNVVLVSAQLFFFFFQHWTHLAATVCLIFVSKKRGGGEVGGWV